MNQVYRIFEENTRGELGGSRASETRGWDEFFLSFSPKQRIIKPNLPPGRFGFPKELHRLVRFPG